MQSPLQRLYKTKFVLVSTIATVFGSALLFAAHWVATQPNLHLLNDLPLTDFGIVFVTSGLVVIAFEYVGRVDAAKEANAEFRTAIREERSAIRDSVVEAMAFTPEKMLDVMAPGVLDHVVENSLAKQLGDQALAKDIYRDLKAQVLQSPERWCDLRISATLAPWVHERASAELPMFVATIRYDYRVAQPTKIMRFACVSDLDEYREALADPTMTKVWYAQQKPDMNIPSDELFRLVEVRANGKRQSVRRTTKQGTQVYSAVLSAQPEVGSAEMVLSFTYRALVQERGHLLHLDLTKPTKGLTINFTYGNAGIRYVNTIDYIAAAKQATVSQLPATDPSPSVTLTFDGWIMPKAGVGFVWVLETEMSRA